VNGSELGILVVGSLVGWWGVSWLVDRVRKPNRPREDIASTDATASAANTDSGASTRPTVSQLGATWHSILGVSTSASSAEILAAYQRRVAECDRVRFDSSSTTDQRSQAERDRRFLEDAYEFGQAVRFGRA